MLQAIEIETPEYGKEPDLTTVQKRLSDLLRPLIPLTKDTQSVILEYMQPIVEHKKTHVRFINDIEITFCDDTSLVFSIYDGNIANVCGNGWIFEPCLISQTIIIRTNTRSISYIAILMSKKYKVSFLDGYPLLENTDFKILIKESDAYIHVDDKWMAI